MTHKFIFNALDLVCIKPYNFPMVDEGIDDRYNLFEIFSLLSIACGIS